MKNSDGLNLSVLRDLVATIEARALASSDKSYTASLLEKGTEKCAEKFGEESVEAIIAAVTQDDESLVGEAADVIFHLLVLLKARNIDFAAVLTELECRTAQSGLQEKASRTVKGDE